MSAPTATQILTPKFIEKLLYVFSAEEATPRVQQSAINLLKQVPSPQLLDVLAVAYDSDSGILRNQVVALLFDLARSDPNPNLRKKAGLFLVERMKLKCEDLLMGQKELQRGLASGSVLDEE